MFLCSYKMIKLVWKAIPDDDLVYYITISIIILSWIFWNLDSINKVQYKEKNKQVLIFSTAKSKAAFD